jgi:light-regulated signal transduction histidine kinase (bacteriophytochrome)/CheY-like chemotaxis protein
MNEVSVDLTNCDREPIHVPGNIQSFGYLIAVSSDWLISRVSANIANLMGKSPDDVLGLPLLDFLGGETLHVLRNRAAMLRGDDAIERAFGLTLVPGGPMYDASIHFSGRSIVIELEAVSQTGFDAATLVRGMMSRLGEAQDMTRFFAEGARQVRALTDFDRVMVYRFDREGSGEVVAESLKQGVDSFLGLHYPASDIPMQARALYLRSTFRIIADVKGNVVPIVPTLDIDRQPLDQSISILRAVSPIHLEYLRNMGVGASLSISIIVDGRLWGLFACHHYSPRLPSFAQRIAAELFGQMFSLTLEGRERRAGSDYEAQARAIADRLMAAVAQDGALLADAAWLGEIISTTVPADGVAVYINGTVETSGKTPNREQLHALARLLNTNAGGQVFATDWLASLTADAADYAATASGMLAIPLSRAPRDYVILFRTERLRKVRWGGNLQKEIELGPNGPRLTPRKSFEEWSELVKGRSEPFTAAQIRVAETLRVALLEVLLRLSETAGDDRRRAADRQVILIAELNHRVRNILALIRGLISQTRDSSLSAEAFVATLDDRVQALARAHDQLTSDRWGPARLIDLIRTESEAYLGERRQRVTHSGVNVLIDPTAFTVMALVIHELMTNATKYGALSDDGSVEIEWEIEPSGSLIVKWTESGGPLVEPPSHRGFGSTIIENSVPYDLGGTAQVEYPAGGLTARFCIPSRYIAHVLEDYAPALPIAPKYMIESDLLAGEIVLLVEDSMIIALDGEDALIDIGAREVFTAPSVVRSLALIEEGRISFAVLDYNLGGETSVSIAEQLLARGIPFIFATGYGEALELPGSLKGSIIVKKPYNAVALTAAIAMTRQTRGAENQPEHDK